MQPSEMSADEQAGTEVLRQETLEVYRACSGALTSYARRLTSDLELARDAVQEGFLRFFLVRMQGEIIRNPSAWLHRVVHNYICETVRSSAVQACVALDDETLGKAQVAPQTGNVEWEEAFRALLAPREFECLRLRTEGLDYSEIADAMSVRPGTVGALLHRVGQKMRRAVQRKGSR
jgi:RNA polymerase sigma-70 factor (ECF subfamily)